MNYNDFIILYKNNLFREIDKYPDAKKFYFLRSISKSKTLKKFCNNRNINDVFLDKKITEDDIASFIKSEFMPKTNKEIKEIEAELNKMQNFDWGGSMGNSLEKNIVNNYIKKMYKYEDIQDALNGSILNSVHGYTMNSWYNHWSSIMIEEIFNAHNDVLPTIDLVEKIDFFINGTPYDLKVTYFPEELMKEKMASDLLLSFGSKSELTCTKRIAKEIDIAIPTDLKDRALLICLQTLLRESVNPKAQQFIVKINEIKQKVIQYYKKNPNELMIWLYENQGEMRFDAANRFFVVLMDTNNLFDSWKLKRNVDLLKNNINRKIDEIIKQERNNLIDFYWKKDGKMYTCISEVVFVSK